MKKKNKIERLNRCDSKAFYKATVIKTVWMSLRGDTHKVSVEYHELLKLLHDKETKQETTY